MQVTESKLSFFQTMHKDLTTCLVIVYAMPESAKLFAIVDIDRALSRNLLHHRIAHASLRDKIAKSIELVERSGNRGAVVLRII